MFRKLASFASCLLVYAVAPAATVALVNATESNLVLKLEHPGDKAVELQLFAGEIQAVRVGREPTVKIKLDGKEMAFSLDPYHAYMFVPKTLGGIAFSGVDLAGKMPKIDDVPEKPNPRTVLRLTVNLYGDDAIAITKEAWGRGAKERFEAAAEAILTQTGVAFKAGELGDYESSKFSKDLNQARADFELQIKTKAELRCLGFTGRTIPGETFGTLGEPAATHLLLRDRAPKLEAERVEVVAQLLGSWLGAVRSPDRLSAMRSPLGDGQAVRKGHRIQLDPINLLIANIWADELSAGRGPRAGELSRRAKERLAVLYKTIAGFHDELKTEDGTAKERADLFDQFRSEPESESTLGELNADRKITGEEAAIRKVVAAIAAKATELSKKESRPKGDALTIEYIRAAAKAAGELEEKVRVRAFCIGLGLGLDHSTVLRGNPLLKKLAQSVESDTERQDRLAVLGNPTLRSRRDLCQHFVVSAALTELFGEAGAELVGLAKELADSKTESGFSFVDLAVDLAGIEFAAMLRKEPKRLAELAIDFEVKAYIPEIKKLVEGLSEAKFQSDFGGSTDVRFKDAVAELKKGVKELKAYGK